MIVGLDHVVIVVRDFETALAFYTRALGCEPLGVEDWRHGRRRFPSLRAGRTMINVHRSSASGPGAARGPRSTSAIPTATCSSS
jgi:catechol 2,3-dioxygenase-like lactoylglutathione lyase family enzyme